MLGKGQQCYLPWSLHRVRVGRTGSKMGGQVKNPFPTSTRLRLGIALRDAHSHVTFRSAQVSDRRVPTFPERIPHISLILSDCVH